MHVGKGTVLEITSVETLVREIYVFKIDSGYGQTDYFVMGINVIVHGNFYRFRIGTVFKTKMRLIDNVSVFIKS
jgi:hypothetical protein